MSAVSENPHRKAAGDQMIRQPGHQVFDASNIGMETLCHDNNHAAIRSRASVGSPLMN
jgi:hypothetical protein